MCDVCSGVDARRFRGDQELCIPVEQQINQAFNTGSERDAWISNIAKNGRAIKAHLEATLGSNPQVLRQLPRINRMHGFQGDEPNACDKLDSLMQAHDHVQACRDMTHKHKHVLPSS